MPETVEPVGSVSPCDFRNTVEAVRFYEDRYKRGYMEVWSPWKKARVHALVKELQLPGGGRGPIDHLSLGDDVLRVRPTQH